jgi:hypothetical protein
MDNSELILAELQSLRADYNEHARDTGERLASLETSMKALIGNGRAGRIELLERAVEALQQWRWKVVGIATGVSGLVSLVAWMVKH